VGSALNKKPFTVWEPKPEPSRKGSWWAQPTREAFMAAHREECARIAGSKAIEPSAQSAPTARQSAQQRTRKPIDPNKQFKRVMGRMRP
jgi:hypothetical protein